MTNQPQLRHSSLRSADLGDGRITAAVVNIDDLIFDKTVEGSANFLDKRGDIVSFVSYWDDDREIHASVDLTPFDSADKSVLGL